MKRPPDGPRVPSSSASASSELLQRARDGDERALDRLFRRYLPQLRRWAHGRVPAWARGASDTADLVQDTMLHTLRRLPHFEARQRGALLHYLRRGLMNRAKDQLRNAARHPDAGTADDDLQYAGASPLEVTIDNLHRERYLEALGRLRAADRAAIVGRVELGYSYEELQAALSSPSPQAARQFVRRALLRLANEMRRE